MLPFCSPSSVGHLSKSASSFKCIRLIATHGGKQEASRTANTDSITSTWSLKLDLGDRGQDSNISVTSIINEMIREWLGPRKKKERGRYSWFVRTRSSGREVDADGFLFKPGERLSVPGYLIRGIVYDLSSLSLGSSNLDQLVDRGVIPKELLPPAPDVEPETLGLGELLTDQAGGSRVGSTTKLKDGRDQGANTASQSNPLNVTSPQVAALSAGTLGEGVNSGRKSILKRETEEDLVGLLEGRRASGAQTSTSFEESSISGGESAGVKVLGMAAALDAIKGGVTSQATHSSLEPGRSEERRPAGAGINSQPGAPSWDSASVQKSQNTQGGVNLPPGKSENAPELESDSTGGGTWLTAALDESAKPKPVVRREVELDQTIRNKYEGKLRSLREKAATRKEEGKAINAGNFDISQATKVGWKGGAIAVPGIGGGKRWMVLPGAGELLKHLKERGLKQGLLVSASDPDKDETLKQLLDFKFSPLEEVASASDGSGTPVSPETFRRVCDQWGLPPKQVLVIAGPGPIGSALLNAVGDSGCYLCQMSPYGAAPAPFPSLADGVTSATETSASTDAASSNSTSPLTGLKQWLGIDDEIPDGRASVRRGRPHTHFKVEDVLGLKAVVEDLNGVSYRRSTMMRGLGSGRERAAASADTEKVLL